MARGVWVSPWSMRVVDYAGAAIEITIAFNTSTLAIIAPGLVGYRDPACLYDRVLIGRPGGGMRVARVPDCDFAFGPAVMANRGFSTIQQVVDANITFGVSEVEN